MAKSLTPFEQARNNAADHAGGAYSSAQLDPLERYYCSIPFLPQTQQGVLNTLNCLPDAESYTSFLWIQPLLMQPCIKDATTSPPILRSFFHFAALFQLCPGQLLQLVRSVYHMRQYYFDSAGMCNVLHELFTVSMYALDEYSDNNCTALCTMLMNRFLIFQDTCQTAEHHMQPYLPPSRVITATGGDLHFGGSPLFFSWLTHRFVYKPRCMEVQYHLVRAIQAFNACMPDPTPPDPSPWAPACQIPILDSLLFGPPNFLCSGYIEFADHVARMTPEEASRYAVRLGALICFAKLFGCFDLHRENVMATAAGPAIIDGECSFLRHVIRSRKMNATCILSSITGKTRVEENCNFSVGDTDFCTAVKSTFRGNLDLGFTTAAAACVKNRNVLWQVFYQALDANIAPRIVPYLTASFQTNLVNYFQQTARIQQAMLQDISSEIGKVLQADGITAGAVNLFDQLKGAFRQGLVPFFQIRQFASCAILMDGTPVVRLPVGDLMDIQREFMDNLDWMATLQSPLS